MISKMTLKSNINSKLETILKIRLIVFQLGEIDSWWSTWLVFNNTYWSNFKLPLVLTT